MPTEQSAGSGIIEIFSTQDGLLYIDNNPVGNIVRGETLTFQRQAAGTHRIQLNASALRGLAPTSESKDVKVESGRMVYVVFGAESPVDNSGKIAVGTLVVDDTHAIGGHVSIDNVDFGPLQTDGQITIANLMAGPHKVQINQGDRITSYPVLIKANQTEHLVDSPNIVAPPTGLTATVY